MGWRGFASTVAAAAMVLFAGCTITHGGTMVDLVSSNHHFQWSSLGDVIEGYVYVPQSDPGIKLTVGEYVFPSADGAPDGWVPAVGAAVTVDLGGDLVPVTARTDARGYFSFSVGSGGGVIVSIDFLEADPEWTRTRLALVTVDKDLSATLETGLVVSQKDLASISQASAVASIQSATGHLTASNSSEVPVTLDLWLSRTAGLITADLFDDFGDPIVSDAATKTHHVWQGSLPAGAAETPMDIPWGAMANPAAILDMLNPNTDRAQDGTKVVLAYVACRPSSSGTTLSWLQLELVVEIDPTRLQRSVAGCEAVETRTLNLL